jgi:hypothetical protein
MIVHRKASSGFVLALVVWIVAILGLIMSAVHVWIQTAVSNAQSLRDRLETRLAVANIRNELIYLLATRPMSVRGLEVGDDLKIPDASDMTAIMSAEYESNQVLAFDGRIYAVESQPGFAIRLQDGRGLAQLNEIAPARLTALLGLFDIPERDRTPLIDALADYIDEDSLNRLSGAEERDYRLAKRRPPSNQPLLTPYEAKMAFGWSDLDALWATDLNTPLVTTCLTTGFNPNTAPLEVLLAALPRLQIENATQIIQQRQQKPLRNQRELSTAAGATLFEEPFFYSFVPGACSIIDVFNLETGDRDRLSLTLTPLSKIQPWRYDYELEIPRNSDRASNRPAPGAIFPSPEAVSAKSAEQLGTVGVR